MYGDCCGSGERHTLWSIPPTPSTNRAVPLAPSNGIGGGAIAVTIFAAAVGGEEDGYDTFIVMGQRVEIAEMVGHIVSLIALRGVILMGPSRSANHHRRRRSFIHGRMEEARRYLASERPLVRAHGITLVRRLARGTLQD